MLVGYYRLSTFIFVSVTIGHFVLDLVVTDKWSNWVDCNLFRIFWCTFFLYFFSDTITKRCFWIQHFVWCRADVVWVHSGNFSNEKIFCRFSSEQIFNPPIQIIAGRFHCNDHPIPCCRTDIKPTIASTGLVEEHAFSDTVFILFDFITYFWSSYEYFQATIDEADWQKWNKMSKYNGIHKSILTEMTSSDQNLAVFSFGASDEAVARPSLRIMYKWLTCVALLFYNMKRKSSIRLE